MPLKEHKLMLILDSGAKVELDKVACVTDLVKDLELLALTVVPAPKPRAHVGGHLFVVQSDIREVRCDAWMVPSSGSWLGILHHWLPEWLNDVDDSLKKLSSTQCPSRTFIGTVDKWPTEKDAPANGGQPAPYVCNLPPRIGKLAQACREFIQQAVSDIRAQDLKPRFRRATHLLALPLVGTGMGGYRSKVAEVCQSILPVLQEEALQLGVDVVIVVFEHSHFLGVQHFRKTWQAASPELTDLDRCKAEELAKLAVEGRLSFFIGAGVSMGGLPSTSQNIFLLTMMQLVYRAGLPSWGSLLQHLAEEAKMDKDEISELWKLGDYLDMASIIQHRLGGPVELRTAVAQKCQCQGFGLTHALITTIPCSAYVTQNYDDLLEKAALAVKNELAVMPYEDASNGQRFLLKMHGCINFPQDIVLTRQDYMRYEGRRAALSAVVQTLLVTKHMCFLGFSLTDTNFHKAIDSIEQAFETSTNQDKTLGTAVVLSSTPFTKALHPNIQVHAMRELSPGESAGATASLDARKHEIFLDYIGIACASTTGHLLDPAFKDMLTEKQVHFVKFLNDCLTDPGISVDLPEYDLFCDLIRSTFGSAYFKTNRPTYFEKYWRG